MTFVQWCRPVGHIIRKEFLQILHDRMLIRMVLFMPIMQMLLLGYAATTDLKNIRLAILDQDRSVDSRRLAESFFQNNLFVPASGADTPRELEGLLFRGRADMTVWIPNDYSKDLAAYRTATVGLAVDGENSNAAGRALGYAIAVIQQEENRRIDERFLSNPNLPIHIVEARTRFFYNPELESRDYMVPGILVMLVTMICTMLTGMAVVREKEMGTLEQLLVTPLTSRQLIAGKLIPFAILAIIEICIAVPLALVWFGLTFAGSFLLLLGCSLVYLLAALGGGLLASTVSNTQQQAMFTIWFVTVFGFLTCGYFYPIENMPHWIYVLTYANPLRFFMTITRGIFLKGAQFTDVVPSLIPLFIMGTVTFVTAVLRFRKRIG
jgi:ABC-2 type transport system permease protein